MIRDAWDSIAVWFDSIPEDWSIPVVILGALIALALLEMYA